jgi:replication-associated recombination protein RarA
MSEFVVSARKYRPQTFDTVVGQRSITSTLRNAIKNDHLCASFFVLWIAGELEKRQQREFWPKP